LNYNNSRFVELRHGDFEPRENYRLLKVSKLRDNSSIINTCTEQ